MEYDQIYPKTSPQIYPEITAVSMSVIDEANGVYQLTIRDDQYKCSNNANPFFFWSARQGTFLPVEGYDDYRSVKFTVDPDALNKSVKVVVGIGDSLGYIDRKAVVINRGAEAAEVEASESNIMTLAKNGELTENDITAEESDTAVSLAIGIDTSADMQKFDQGSTKNWMDSVEGLIESANTGVETVLVTDDNFGYTKDAESAKSSLDLIKTNEYSGSSDALSLLNRCDEALSDRENISQSGNKVAVVFVQNVGDIAKLKEKKEELENKGTAVYIMVLSDEDISAGDDENIYVCKTELDLRLKVSKLYAAFGNIAEVMTTPADGETVTSVYTSDFKVGKHNFNTTENTFGTNLASVLGIYGCLPIYTETYSLKTEDAYNVANGDAHSVSTDAVSDISNFFDSLTLDDTLVVSSDLTDALDKNLNYRFPVVIYKEDNEGRSESKVITGKVNNTYYYNGSVTNTISDLSGYKLIDTYEYLMESAKGTNIVDYIKTGEELYENIRFTKPADYTNTDVKIYNWTLKSQITPTVEGEYYKISSPETNNIIVRGVKTKFENGIPNIHNANVIYIVKKYSDVGVYAENLWYYPAVYKATNLGIVNGDTDRYTNNTLIPGSGPQIYINAEQPITRAAFFKVLLECAKVELNEVTTSEHWAKNYINYIINNVPNSLYTNKSIDDAFFEEAIPREEAAFAIKTVFMDRFADTNVANNLYMYDDNISCEQMTKWKNAIGLNDKNEISGGYLEAVKQLLCNNIMTGDGYKYNPKSGITRAEMLASIMRCLFTLDEGLKNAEIVNEGQANYIDLSSQNSYTITQTSDKTGSGEFYFVAPKTGYYFIGVKDNTYTIQERIGNDVNSYKTLIDDFEELYSGFGETVPAYITEKMRDAGYNYKRYYINRGSYIKLNKLSGTTTNIKIETPKDGDIAFRPNKDGTFIYASNPEYVGEQHLINREENSQLLMKLNSLQPGKYTLMAWHNYTSSHIGAYIDFLFHANEDTRIKINSIGIELPRESSDWTATQAYANFKKTNIGGNMAKSLQPGYEGVNFVHTFDVQNQETMNQWLGNDIYNYIFNPNYYYPELHNEDNLTIPIFIIFEFEIEYGSLDLIEAAYETEPNLSKVLNLNESNAPYVYDTTYKGVDNNTLRGMTTDFNYTLSDNSPEYLPVRVFNSYNPRGYESLMWMTQINPQSDGYSHVFLQNSNKYLTRNIAAESDMLKLKYYDRLKSDSGYWYFDSFHHKDKNNELINSLSSPGEIVNSACEVGNYSVETIYEIELTNIGNDKIVEFRMNNWQNNIIEIYNCDTGEYEIISTGSGDSTASDFNTNDRLIKAMRVNKDESVRYRITVTLVTGDPGGMKNYLKCYNV